MKANRDYHISELNLSQSEFSVVVTRYAGPMPAEKSIVIFPPTGGVNVIDRSYARRFAKAGFDVYLLEKWSDQDDSSIDLELHQRFYSRAQRALGITLAEIKSSYIGLLGTSVGALHASISAATEDRLDGVFVITGGTSIAEVIVTSDQKAMRGLKEDRKKRYGFKNDQENIQAIENAFQLEPSQLGDRFKNKDLGMVIALEDSTVPTKTQIQLKDFWSPQLVINYPSGHFWGIVKAWWYDDQTILDFFEKSFLHKGSKYSKK